MLAHVIHRLQKAWRELNPQLAAGWAMLTGFVRRLWQVAKPPLLVLVQVLAALALLFEEWGWRPLSAALGRLARFRPWALIELWLAGLPPYGALAAFALPSLLLLPLKFISVYLLANGMVLMAGLLFIGAKIASTALIARIFLLVKPALMQIGWFAALYDWFMPWKEAIFAEIRASWVWRYGRMVKTAVRLEAKQAWARWRPILAALAGSHGRRVRALAWRLRAAWRIARSRGAELGSVVREAWTGLRRRLAR